MTQPVPHTPTPWSRNIPPISKYGTIFAGRNDHVFVFMMPRHGNLEQAEADVDFLLSAVNAHDALVAALEQIRDADPVDLALDPEWSSRIAHAALSPLSPRK